MKYDSKLQSLADGGYDFNMSSYINQGYSLFKENIGGFVGFAAIYIAVSLIANYIPGGIVISIFLQPILVVGFYIVANDILVKQQVDFSRFFKGFEFYIHLFVSGLVIGVFVAVGIFALIIPGLYFAVAYAFTPLFVVFLGYDYWPAMEWSRKIITKNFWPVFGFFLVLGLINIGGLLFFGVGLLFTLPATACMFYSAFEDVVGGEIRKSDL